MDQRFGRAGMLKLRLLSIICERSVLDTYTGRSSKHILLAHLNLLRLSKVL
jgi:hypothetical protein